MKATGALPTEDRIQRMNDQQWLWYYLNLLEDEKEEELKWKTRLDYMGWWVNPSLAKSVMEQERNNKNKQKVNPTENINVENNIPTTFGNENQIIVKGDIVVNDGFEQELKKALGGSQSDGLTILPDSESAGDPGMSQEDFINKALIMQEISTPNQKVSEQFDGIDDFGENDINTNIDYNSEDIDYFEYPDEGQ